MIDLNNKISEIVYIIQPIEDKFCKENLDEIVDLVKSAGAEVYGYKTQVIKNVTPATYIGKGKLEEIKLAIEKLGGDFNGLIVKNSH